MAEPAVTADDPADPGHEGLRSRRLRFRQSLSELAKGSTADDLVRWMLVPGSIAVVLGFNVMLFGWIGAARTAREIEQIPYLISGGLFGLAFVVLGGLLLVSTFWVAVLRKLESERAGAAQTELDVLRARVEELEGAARATPARRRAAPRRSSNSTAKAASSA